MAELWWSGDAQRPSSPTREVSLKKQHPAAAAILLATIALLGLSSCGSGSSGDSETLHGVYSGFPDALDPAISYTQEGWTAMYDTYIPLLTYAHANGLAGGRVVPGLAKSLPKISDGGRTYTLVLRPGLKYSNGKAVEASDFSYAVERLFRLNSPGAPFYTDIVGAEAFAKSKQGGISGIETDDGRGEIVIHLVEPRGTFSNELAMLFVAPLPTGTPAEDLSTDPPPATGPYEIAKASHGGWEYDRNPVWAQANSRAMPDLPSGHFDHIKIDVLTNPNTEVNDIEQGRYEWMQPPPPPDRYAGVKSKYEGSQFRIEPGTSTYYFWMNMTRPPFDDVEIRRAVNYAVDSEALERIYAGQLSGGQQILPPSMPGYRRFQLYPHNLEKAKAMVRGANPSDRQVTVWTDDEPENREAAEYYEGVLKEIGLEPTLKVVNAANYLTLTGNQSTPDLDTGWNDWFEDYPHPNDFFQPLFAGESIAPTNNNNRSETDIPKFNREIAELGHQPLGPKQEAAYAKLDREMMGVAPWAPYGTRTVSTFVSDAIDLESVIFNPAIGQDLTSFELK
jgi:peptide/nickel transport system substrate-binding protein